MIKLLRITTISHSLDLLLKGQLKYVGEAGFKVSIACTNDNNIDRIEERENVEYHELKLTRTLNPLKDLFSLIQAINLIKKLRPDIVHSHSPKAGIIGMLSAWICMVPLKIHTVAGLPLTEATGLKRKLLILVEKFTYFCADFILPNSNEQKDFIEENIYKSKKVQIIGRGSSNGIDLEYFNPNLYGSEFKSDFRNKLGLNNSSIVFCFVGRLANYKGINELVSAFVDLNNVYKNISLLLVGPFEDLNPLLAETIETIKSNSNIKCVGHQNDIRPYLSVSDIFVFPSYREGFPQSLMQASAMNLACIASDINGCNEIIENGVNGLLIEPKNKQDIYDSCEKLIVNYELRSKFTLAGRKNMEDNFEQKAFWDKLINFYKVKLNGE
ncbi:glycosyltransferase family 4 protein [Sphingobacterium mizutaii]|uniref:glycosyltransferase family 4 protein n=1 Tax=Sphingobacterium mizutaii TaxID=1010 RepID=UPI003D986BDA